MYRFVSFVGLTVLTTLTTGVSRLYSMANDEQISFGVNRSGLKNRKKGGFFKEGHCFPGIYQNKSVTFWKHNNMSIKTIQDILPMVENPSRYLGTETNTITKAPGSVDLNVALAFPDLYEIGTSHFGIQILYHLLNLDPKISAERVFAPGNDMESYLKKHHIPLVSLESKKPLKSFDIVGFSLLYELNFTNVLLMLELGGIPFMANSRDEGYPLIIAGGPCTCNPEPMADFFDAMVVGDGEECIIEMTRAWLDWKNGGNPEKDTLLAAWSRIEGVYIPSFFNVRYDHKGLPTAEPKIEGYHKVTRTLVKKLDDAPFPGAPIVAYGKPIHDRLRLEISRGCTRGCRFCQAGMIYRPVRERSVDTILGLCCDSIRNTGYEDISLLSLSTGDYSSIVQLMRALMSRYADDHLAVSLPSLRAGTLTPELMEEIKRVRKTGFTIAPEAGSQRLRNVINKNINRQEILNTVTDAFELGWQVLKLYFMIGLPTETPEDVQSIVEMVKELKKIKGSGGRKGRINVSATTFIPKAHTPFQWEAQIDLETSRAKIDYLKSELNTGGVHFKWQNPEVSIMEGLWARGDRRLGNLLVAAYQRGCSFDGWSDGFKFNRWQEALSETGMDIDFYTTRKRDLDESLPWEHIETRVSKEYLKAERKRALCGEITDDCRDGACQKCGVCDFERIEPRVFPPHENDKHQSKDPKRSANGYPVTLEVVYSKSGEGRYFGHLELVRIFQRAIYRAGISVKFSQGFHPKPRISFQDPLPIGIESLGERFYMNVPGQVRVASVKDAVNRHLPPGLRVEACTIAPEKKRRKSADRAFYMIEIKDGFFSQKELDSFLEKEKLVVEKRTPKGKIRQTDLRESVLSMEITSPRNLTMALRQSEGKTVRPGEVLLNLFKMSHEEIKTARIIKLNRDK
jgi:radical SAM family uncharacterized protein/radical SAM-linked protein